MRCISVSWLLAAVLFLTAAVSAEARSDKKVGVLLWSEESRYFETTRGVIDELNKEGFKSSMVTVENARVSKAKLAEIVNRYARSRMDLVLSIGTTATVAAARQIKDTPLVFGYVYEPVEANVALGWKSSGNNTTGASSKVPMARLLETLKDFAQVTRLAVLYTPGEKNSEAQLRELEALQGPARIRVIPVIVPREDEVPLILPGVMRMADAVYLSGSSVVGNTVNTIVDQANRSRVITITHLDDLVEKGVLLGVCPDPYQLGRLAGKKAARILKGAKPSSLPIEPAKKLDVILNARTAKAGHFTVSPAVLKKVTRVLK